MDDFDLPSRSILGPTSPYSNLVAPNFFTAGVKRRQTVENDTQTQHFAEQTSFKSTQEVPFVSKEEAQRRRKLEMMGRDVIRPEEVFAPSAWDEPDGPLSIWSVLWSLVRFIFWLGKGLCKNTLYLACILLWLVVVSLSLLYHLGNVADFTDDWASN